MVGASLKVDALPPAAAGEAIELFDRTFLLARGRAIPFAQRFHDLLAGDDSLVVSGRSSGQLASALLLRFFSWIGSERECRGAMIGLVCTSPQFHGRGCATELLEAAAECARAEGCEFAVLWAARHELYERGGWAPSDNGILGIHVPQPGHSVRAGVIDQDAARAKIHALHEARPAPRVRRSAAHYGHLLPPAESLLFFLERDSFAICGRHGHTGYLYDISAHEGDLPRLWAAVTGSFDRLHVNVEDGSGTHLWLTAQPGFQWARQRLAMWKPLASSASPLFPAYIPFFDRI